MELIHYQTLEAVGPDELQALRVVKGEFNAQRAFNERIKLWRKSDILDGMEPRDARWGFTRARDDEDRLLVVLTVRRMSAATPRLTWLLYDDGDGGREVVIKAGKPVA
jgi:hypothetical protein